MLYKPVMTMCASVAVSYLQLARIKMFDTKSLTVQMAGGRAVPIEYDLPQSEVKKRCVRSVKLTTENFKPKICSC